MVAYTTYEHEGTRHLGEVSGTDVIPLAGLSELGSATSIDVLAQARREEAGAVSLDRVRILPVVPNPAKVVCVGLNYLNHVQESKRDLPTYPVLFPKYASSLLGAYEDIMLPPESEQVDYEGELAVVVGRAGRRIAEHAASDHVLGYTIANDVTMRDYQYKTHQWMQGKAWDASTPLGPALVTPDEIDLHSTGIRTVLSGEKVQESDLSQLIFSVPRLISLVSTFMALQPGDLILTGTPGGVGYRRDPQRLLTPGDRVSVEVDGIGMIDSLVRGAEEPR